VIEEVLQRKGFWIVQGPQNHVVMSSRVRLARNMRGLPFPHRMDRGEIDLLRSVLEKYVGGRPECSIIDIHDIGNNEKRLLRERNIITSEMELCDFSYVIITPEDECTILVNEEDHLRIQVIKSGLQLLDAYGTANRVDDDLNRFIPYAFSEELGYLTACVTNLGTGLRVSVLIHLPMLTRKNMLGEISETLKKRGADIKSTVPNSTKTLGSLYMLSNRRSLGVSEIDILETVDGMVSEIIEMEDHERDTFYAESQSELEDRIWRSFGQLQYSRKITYIEAMEHLSNVRLGIILAVIKNLELPDINDIMVRTQWSHLQRRSGRVFVTTVECDEYRAEFLRGQFS
jgi:protein arginine kinase